VEFSAILKIAEKTGAKSIEELQEHITFGKRCRLCHHYVKRGLKTGETVFTEILYDENENDAEVPPEGT
jgi:bacterioferritin-associated ferredoxin